MIAQMVEIKSRLKEEIMVSVGSCESYLKGPWEVVLETERNQFPYWLKWRGNDIQKLLCHCLNYLNGKEEQPHGNNKINPEAWQKEKTP